MRLHFDVGFAFVAYDAKTNAYFERHFLKLTARLPGELSSLTELVKDEPQHLVVVNRVHDELSKTLDLLAASKRTVDAGGKFDLMEAFALKGQPVSVLSPNCPCCEPSDLASSWRYFHSGGPRSFRWRSRRLDHTLSYSYYTPKSKLQTSDLASVIFGQAKKHERGSWFRPCGTGRTSTLPDTRRSRIS